VSTQQITEDQRQIRTYVVAETPTREWRRNLRDSLSPTYRSDAAHTTRLMRTYRKGRYSRGHYALGTARRELRLEPGRVLAVICEALLCRGVWVAIAYTGVT
jgi:hypothetical protein